jgi:hypothetical protein
MSVASQFSDDTADRLDLVRRQYSVLSQLQEVTRRWHEEKEHLMKSFEEEREIWADERTDLQQQVWSMTEAWKKASVDLVQTTTTLNTVTSELQQARLSPPKTLKRPGMRFLSHVDPLLRASATQRFWKSTSMLYKLALVGLAAALVVWAFGRVRASTAWLPWLLALPSLVLGDAVATLSMTSLWLLYAPVLVWLLLSLIFRARQPAKLHLVDTVNRLLWRLLFPAVSCALAVMLALFIFQVRVFVFLLTLLSAFV